MHEVEPAADENVFTGHEVQAPSAELLNVPAGHASQVSGVVPGIYPGSHGHEKLPWESMHVALAPQGSNEHSLTFVHDFPSPIHPMSHAHTLVPQVALVSQPPQLTVPRFEHAAPVSTIPQLSPASVQKAVGPEHPHTLTVPPPPHVSGAVQEPQFAVLENPQLSSPVTTPQFLPTRAQNSASVSDVQPQILSSPAPPHVSGRVQPPQSTSRIWPQISIFW